MLPVTKMSYQFEFLINFLTCFDSASNSKINFESTCIPDSIYQVKLSFNVSTMANNKGSFVGLSCNKQLTVILATTFNKNHILKPHPAVFRGLLDSCAQAQFISQHACQVLQLKTRRFNEDNVNGVTRVSASNNYP